MKLSQRQQFLLKTIINEHLKTSEPVGSQLLSDRTSLGLSSATLRNEMVELEELGYLFQPFTSAGRVPTEKGYQYYIKHFFSPGKISKDAKEALEKIQREDYPSYERYIKEMAKAIAEITSQMVMVGFSKHEAFYTGISHLFHKKEFQDISQICGFSEVIDHLDEAIASVYDTVDVNVSIRVGSENSFFRHCSSLLVEFPQRRGRGIIGILGPMRMNYEKNVSVLKYTVQNLL